VILEEQEDGSYKVQGVRKGAGIPEGADIAAEAAKAAAAGDDESHEVQSLIKKLQDGRLKLPSQNQEPPALPPRTVTSFARNTPVTTRQPPTTTTTRATTTTTTTTTTTEAPFTFSPPRANPSFLRPTAAAPAFLPTAVSPSFSRSQGSEASQSTQVNLQVPSPSTVSSMYRLHSECVRLLVRSGPERY
jgi:hypothetical protein